MSDRINFELFARTITTRQLHSVRKNSKQR